MDYIDNMDYITYINNNTWLYVLFIISIIIGLIFVYKIIQSLTNTETNYNWTYNTYNNNKYVLLFIITILVFIIYIFNYTSRKQDLSSTTVTTSQKSNFNNISNNMSNEYEPPIITNPYNNLFISNAEKDQWKIAKSLLDGNEESLQNTNGSPNNYYQGYGYVPKNDILQTNSTLFSNNSNKVESVNTSTIGDYASLDSLGKGLTDTLGGIHTELGYTVLDEQLGTFKKEEIHNPYTYDETANYNTGMSANTINGNDNGVFNYSAGNYGKCGSGQPIFLQKDFDGVANIFAPNIIIQNPPLTSDGYPDISIRM